MCILYVCWIYYIKVSFPEFIVTGGRLKLQSPRLCDEKGVLTNPRLDTHLMALGIRSTQPPRVSYESPHDLPHALPIVGGS